jgi:hypothetical protein
MPNASKQHCSYYLAASYLPTLPYYAPDLQLLLVVISDAILLYYCSLFTECLLLLLSPVLFLCYIAMLVLLFLIISAPTLQQIRVPVLQLLILISRSVVISGVVHTADHYFSIVLLVPPGSPFCQPCTV